MVRPKFSIVIPCYKVEAYIRESLDSVLAQTCKDWEAICTDDGSPDNTGNILDDYAAQDPRIKVIHQPNGGLSAARNAALAKMSGEWIVYLDADDLLATDTLEYYQKMLAQYPDADLLHMGALTFDDGKSFDWGARETKFVRWDVSKTITPAFIVGLFPQFAFKADMYRDITFEGGSWCEDRPYFAKVAARAKLCVERSVNCYAYRLRAGSIVHMEMKLETLKGFIDAGRISLQTFIGSGKYIEPLAMRMLVNYAMEGSANHLFNELDKRCRSVAVRYLRAGFLQLSNVPELPCWDKFVILMFKMFPFKFMVWILLYLPDWLKRKGFHR